VVELGSFSLAQVFTPGKVKGTRLVLASFRRLRFDVKNDEPFKEKPPKGGWIEIKYFSFPRRKESVSKLVSEPGAVAMGSNNSAKLDDPVATALGSDTDSKSLG